AVQPLHSVGHLGGERGPGLDDHHRLLAAFDRALPAVDRGHMGQDVHASRKLALHQLPAGRLRLDSRGPSRIHEHRAFHGFLALLAHQMTHGRAGGLGRAMLRKTGYERIAFVASPAPEARKALARLSRRYGNVSPAKADVVVALGGDGLMLRTLHKLMEAGKPIYGMHRGTVGFLMNEFSEAKLRERLAAAHITVIHPLAMRARDTKGRVHEHYAINEVSLFRQTYQVAHMAIEVDGQERMPDLMGDGVLVSTPAGSTAYN